MTYPFFIKLCIALQAALLLLRIVGFIDWPWMAVVMPTSAAITGSIIAAVSYCRQMRRFVAMTKGARK